MTKKSSKKHSLNSISWLPQANLEACAQAKASMQPVKVASLWVHTGTKAHAPKAWKSELPDSDSVAKNVLRIVDTLPLVKVLVSPNAVGELEHQSSLKASQATRLREAVGSSLLQLERMDVREAIYNFDLPAKDLPHALMGLEIALYRFKRTVKGEASPLRIQLQHRGKSLALKQVQEALSLGRAVNLARHLVNLPPNWLNPVSYAEFVKATFQGLKNVKVEIWDETRLKSEGMNLHLAVGQGSNSPPRLVHLRYRPPGAKGEPIALVGKGITFDSGGLDIKPSSGMRLMKKDMGGSASVVGAMYWAAAIQVKQPIDAYLALAENSVSGHSFRPSDVVTSRNGVSIEIHNTDAEGRLVLADAMDVAVTAKDKPKVLIDVATLTGAIKVAIGAGLAGLFSNSTALQNKLMQAAQETGDLMWPMPLYQKYRAQLNSPFADMVNAADGFGGAITAALFLEKFAKDIPWAHLDIYAWKDSPEGAMAESGGNGQSVMALAHFIANYGRKPKS